MRNIGRIILRGIGLLVIWYLIQTLSPLQIPPLDAFSIILAGILAAPFVFSGLVFLKAPVNWLINRLDNTNVISWLSVYGILSLIISILPFLYLVSYMPTLISQGLDPLTAWYFSGHYTPWLLLTFMVVVLGYNNILKGVMAAAFVYATHEFDWLVISTGQFSRYAYSGQAFGASFFGIFHTLFFGYIPLTLAIMTILGAYFISYRQFTLRREIVILAVPLLWGLVVMVTNFPSTLYLGINTQYYSDFWPNFAEVMTWVVPIIIALWPKTLYIPLLNHRSEIQ